MKPFFESHFIYMEANSRYSNLIIYVCGFVLMACLSLKYLIYGFDNAGKKLTKMKID